MRFFLGQGQKRIMTCHTTLSRQCRSNGSGHTRTSHFPYPMPIPIPIPSRTHTSLGLHPHAPFSLTLSNTTMKRLLPQSQSLLSCLFTCTLQLISLDDYMKYSHYLPTTIFQHPPRRVTCLCHACGHCNVASTWMIFLDSINCKRTTTDKHPYGAAALCYLAGLTIDAN